MPDHTRKEGKDRSDPPHAPAAEMAHDEELGAEHLGEEVQNSDIVGKAATIAVVGVGVALISAELLPGMLIGVAAAFLPGIGPKLRPMLKSTVRAGYAAYQKTREMVAEASEQVQDAVAEARVENSKPAPKSKNSFAS